MKFPLRLPIFIRVFPLRLPIVGIFISVFRVCILRVVLSILRVFRVVLSILRVFRVVLSILRVRLLH
jgi:hypothetical protein